VTTIVSAVVLTAGLVADATGGRLVDGSAARAFDGVSIDSRTIAPGALFVALRGERFDGHAFLDRAIGAGAAGVMVSEPPAAPLGVATIVVPDTLTALQTLGHEVRMRSGASVVAITGSAGKTTTKEITADFLSARYVVYRNHGNFNNHIGLPLSLIELRTSPEIAVVELGMNRAGEIRTLVGLAEPDVRVWTNVGDAHIGYFGSREAIADAKAEILEQITNKTVIVANADDPLVMAHVSRMPARTITFGERAGAGVRAVSIEDRGIDGTVADVDSASGRLRLAVPLPGRAPLMNVLAATAVALEFGVPTASIEARTAALQAVTRRGQVTTLADGTRVIDDSYNASPVAVQAMLSALAATPGNPRRIAALGEMLELGDSARALHAACGAAAAGAGVDALLVVGGTDADGLADGAIAAGLDARRVHRFATSAEAANAIDAIVRPGDLVLVKGSHGTRMDVIADHLKGRG
jgi:UDP-N-acetylmuramoyl-tripeptide--D-alanyl-D-alanine ligase